MYKPRGSPHAACAACKFQRRKCTAECALAPWFPPDQPKRFANVHKLFGVSNILKLLKTATNGAQTEDIVMSIVYEADAREKDPVHGAYGNLGRLVRTEIKLERERDKLRIIYERMLLEAQAKHAPAPVSQAAVYPLPSSNVTHLNASQSLNVSSMTVHPLPPFLEYSSGFSTSGPIWDLGVPSVDASSRYPHDQLQEAADNWLPLYTYDGSKYANAQQLAAPLQQQHRFPSAQKLQLHSETTAPLQQQQRFLSAQTLQLHSETTAEDISTVMRSKSETPQPVHGFFSQGVRNSRQSFFFKL